MAVLVHIHVVTENTNRRNVHLRVSKVAYNNNK
jgi:hypothetical protein